MLYPITGLRNCFTLMLILCSHNSGVLQFYLNIESSFAQASLVQSGPGAVFLGVGTAANLTYAGGKNATFVQGTGGLSGLEIANVQYTTTGRLYRALSKP